MYKPDVKVLYFNNQKDKRVAFQAFTHQLPSVLAVQIFTLGKPKRVLIIHRFHNKNKKGKNNPDASKVKGNDTVALLLLTAPALPLFRGQTTRDGWQKPTSFR